MKTLGLRHVALRVKNAQISKKFYMDFLGMDLEWEPDPQNIYLTSNSQDNLALHEEDDFQLAPSGQALDHIGFICKTKNDVDAFYEKASQNNIPIFKEIKQHRDGAYSFYLKDPNGYVVQMIYHPPISRHV